MNFKRLAIDLQNYNRWRRGIADYPSPTGCPDPRAVGVLLDTAAALIAWLDSELPSKTKAKLQSADAPKPAKRPKPRKANHG